MFVSSYNTYVHTSNTNKSSDLRRSDDKEKSEGFSKSLSDLSIVKPFTDKSLPIDYISNYKSFHNHQRLQEQLETQGEYKLKQLSTLNNAKIAYDENSKMFPLTKKPHAPLSQTPKIDEKLPRQDQEAKEQVLRHTMLNTYISNDNYYRVTAA